MASASGGSLPRYIAQRVLLMVPMIWVVLTLVFLLLRVAPGDPVSASVGGRLSEEELDRRLVREGRMELAQACFDFLPARAQLDLAGWPEIDIFAHI